ncbi:MULTISPECIES: hypothetical protein [unclassified Nocardiopsis]|nr:hypothetical protein [Nocardiopsis sp. TSRI0078]
MTTSLSTPREGATAAARSSAPSRTARACFLISSSGQTKTASGEG